MPYRQLCPKDRKRCYLPHPSAKILFFLNKTKGAVKIIVYLFTALFNKQLMTGLEPVTCALRMQYQTFCLLSSLFVAFTKAAVLAYLNCVLFCLVSSLFIENAAKCYQNVTTVTLIILEYFVGI